MPYPSWAVANPSTANISLQLRDKSMAVSPNGVCKQDWLAQLRTGCCVTRFKLEAIPTETLEWILKAGCQTASPWNLQPWQFIVVRSEAGRTEFLRHCMDPGPAATAPVLVVGLGDPLAWKRAPARFNELMRCGSLPPGSEAMYLERIQRQWSVGDAARVFAIAQTHAALQQICLTALACDVCSWWIHEFDVAGLTRALHIPANLLLVGAVGLGYCADSAALPAPSIARTVFAEAYALPWPRPAEEKAS